MDGSEKQIELAKKILQELDATIDFEVKKVPQANPIWLNLRKKLTEKAEYLISNRNGKALWIEMACSKKITLVPNQIHVRYVKRGDEFFCETYKNGTLKKTERINNA